jgi:hypothetical protein
MNDELKKDLERSGSDLISALPGIFLEDTRKTTKSLSQYNRCLDQDSNKEPSKYESRALKLYQSSRLKCFLR